MKLTHVHIENFKGLRECDFSLLDADGRPWDRFCLVGDNGSGKTTVLQAIAWVLEQAAHGPDADLAWPGFLPARIATKGEPLVVVGVRLSAEEVEASREFYALQGQNLSILELECDHELALRPGRSLWDNNGRISRAFKARRLATQLAQGGDKSALSLVPSLPSFHWFEQSRTVVRARDDLAAGWQTDLERLRELLVGWWGLHMSPPNGARDLLSELNAGLRRLLDGTAVVGIRPADGTAAVRAADFLVLLQRNGDLYDVAEMSSGEQVVFQLLLEFVMEQICRSVVMIDELELHLHPPAQQALYNALPSLGEDCQFLITTHSQFLVDGIPDEQIHRLPGGVPCL